MFIRLGHDRQRCLFPIAQNVPVCPSHRSHRGDTINATRTLQFALLALFALSIGCARPGYQKVDGKWAYVTVDAGNGTKVHELNADRDTFVVLNQTKYAKDIDRVFYKLTAIDGADPATFQLINDDKFAKDKTQVFIMTHRIPEADPSSFRILQEPYSRDAKHVYCGTVALPNVDVDAFEPVKCYGSWHTFYNSGTFLFNYGEAFAGLEISKQRPVVVGAGWGRDGKHYYHGPGAVKDADYGSFTVDGEYKASDKNRRFWHVFPEEQSPERRKKFLGNKG